jgi:hypothetical protein
MAELSPALLKNPIYHPQLTIQAGFFSGRLKPDAATVLS